MKTEFLKKLSKEELSWAIYIATDGKTLPAERIQNRIQNIFKTKVSLFDIKTYFANQSEEDFSVEHINILYGHKNNQSEFTKEA